MGYSLSNYLGLLLIAAMSYSSAGFCAEPLSLSTLFKPIPQGQIRSETGSANYRFSTTSGTDTINYAQLCLATDSTCTTCDVPYEIYTATPTSPITITSGGSPYSISPAAITYYLKNYAGITASSTYYVGLYVQSSTENCSGGYCSTNTDSTHRLCMQTSYDGTNAGPITQLDAGAATLNAPIDQIVYVVDSGNRAVYYCTIDGTNPSTGDLSCNPTTSMGVTSPWSDTN